MNTITDRKLQHITLAQDPSIQMNYNPWDQYQLPYECLPELDLKKVDTTTKLFNKPLSQPLIIASMTGGEAHAATINQNLAIAAADTNVAMGVGSQRIMLRSKPAIKSFTLVRKHNPRGLIFANMGAIQLNYGLTVDHYRQIVDAIQADALYLHINPLQEAIQPEGDTNFSKLIEKIIVLRDQLSVPLILKEVGHGLSTKHAQTLIKAGITYIDVAGTGGTSWSGIEARRANNTQLFDWFKDFGIATPQLINEWRQINKQTTLIASGGLRSPLDGLKAGILGADYYSAAYPFLAPALESPEAVIKTIQTWQYGLQIALFATGTPSWSNRSQIKLTSD